MNKTWLKVWIGIGTVASIALLVLPPLLLRVASEDVQRYRECIEGKRNDCKRTMVWNLADAVVLLQQQQGRSLTGTIYEGLNPNSGAIRTSEKSPFIAKVEPVGMSNTNGTYYATPNKEIVFRATMTGVITNSDLYLVKIVDGEASKPEKVAPFVKGEDNIWEATYSLGPGFEGSVEVRAYGTDPKDLAILTLPVAAK